MVDNLLMNKKVSSLMLLLHNQHSWERVHWILLCLIHQQGKCQQVSGPGTVLFLRCACKIQDETDDLCRCYGRQNLWARKIHSLNFRLFRSKGLAFKTKQNKQIKMCKSEHETMWNIVKSFVCDSDFREEFCFCINCGQQWHNSCFFLSWITLLVPSEQFKWWSTSALQALLLQYCCHTWAS